MKDANSYPIKYMGPVQLKDGTLILLRPVHPVDREVAVEFRGKLSAQSVYDRFLGYIPKISQELIDRLTQIDYSTEMAIVAEVHHPKEKEVIAVGRIAGGGTSNADFAIIIADQWQGKGLGTILTNHLIKVAKDMKFEKMYATIFSHNTAMLEILRRKDFELSVEGDNTVYAELVFE